MIWLYMRRGKRRNSNSNRNKASQMGRVGQERRRRRRVSE